MSFGKQRPSAPWSQGHYWGQYDADSDLPNVAGAKLQLESVQAGDVGWVTADGLLYVCVDPTREAAVWQPLAFLGPATEDHQTAKIIVGNEANGDDSSICDILDPGDGSGIRQALSSITTDFPLPFGDIFLRAGTYDVAGELEANGPFVIPPLVHLRGSGPDSTAITGSALERRVFEMRNVAVFPDQNVLSDIRINVIPPDTEGIVSGTAVIRLGSGSITRSVHEVFVAQTNDQLLAETLEAGWKYLGRDGEIPLSPQSIQDCRLSNGPRLVDVDASPFSCIRGEGSAVIESFVSTNGDIGAFAEGREGFQLNGCEFSGVSLYGVLVNQSLDNQSDARNAIIDGCKIQLLESENASGEGVRIESFGITEQVTVTGCLIESTTGNADTGIHVVSPGENTNQLHGFVNNVIRNFDDGVFLGDGVTRCTVGFNRIGAGEVVTPITDDGSANEIAHNTAN